MMNTVVKVDVEHAIHSMEVPVQLYSTVHKYTFQIMGIISSAINFHSFQIVECT